MVQKWKIYLYSKLWFNCTKTLSNSQPRAGLTYSEVAYEETGRYEVALTIIVNDPESTCQAHYGQFLAPYITYRSRYTPNKNYEVPLSWGYTDVSYYKSKYLYAIVNIVGLYNFFRCGLLPGH